MVFEPFTIVSLPFTTVSNIVDSVVSKRHNFQFDCMLCKSVMLDARECSQCQKGFCKKCMNDYIDELIAEDYDVTCPNCGSPNMEIVEPHPVL